MVIDMGNIHASVAVVVNFIDAITQRPVRGGVQVNVAQGNKVIWKDGSCAVILRMPHDGGIDILVESSIYRGTRLYADMKDKSAPIIYNIWLTPTPKYPFTVDMTVLKGETDKETISLARISNNNAIKLIADTSKTRQIKMWGVEGVTEGKCLLIREDETSEIITLLGKSDENNDTYFTRDLIKNIYHKGMAYIYPVTKVSVGKDGKYIMAYKNMSPDETVEIL